MTEPKRCFMDAERPCDLTCKAAFEVDDPVDNVDCHFVWLAYHFGEGMFNVTQMIQSGGGPGPGKPGPMGAGPGAGPGKTPPGSPSDN